MFLHLQSEPRQKYFFCVQYFFGGGSSNDFALVQHSSMTAAETLNVTTLGGVPL